MKKLLLSALMAALVCGPVLAAEAPPATPTPTPSPTPAAQEKGYWLSTSGKRHNGKCRYFKKTKGVSCEEKDGVACKVCGG